MSERQFPDGTGDTEGNSSPQESGTPAPRAGSSPLEADAPLEQTSNDSPGLNSELNNDIPSEESMGEDNANDGGERADNNEENSHRNLLDGLDEIVKLGEENNNSEISLKEEVVDDLAHIIEAIIFASDEPLSVGTIKSVLDAAHTFGRINPDMIVARINTLNNKYDLDRSGFYIIEIANGYQFATRKELAQWVSYLFKEKGKRKLSNSALETLAIIAYKQPITKPEIESIRGVNVDYVLHSLLEKEIVTVVGRAETVGRPLLYGSTQRFLKIFGLKNLEDLPKLREIEEIIKEIRSRGAEESIQLEITAFGEQSAAESANDPLEKQDPKAKEDTPSDDAVPQT